MFFGYLGPVLIQAHGVGVATPRGASLTITSPRQRVVLAVLLTRAGRPVHIDELAEFVWDGNPPAKAAETLRTYVMRLRYTLGSGAGGRIVTRDPGYQIEASEEEVDALAFTRAYRDGVAAYGAGQWARARTALAGGLALWRGEPLTDVPSQLLRDAEVPALERQRLQALQWRIDADLRLGGGEELVAELQELTGREPLREHLHAQLMTALARSGRQAEALAVYQHARDLLVSQLGIEPGPELRELQRRVLAGEVKEPGEAREPTEAREPRVPRQLPAAAWHFAGRTAELEALDAVLAETGTGRGTVTISAIGGMAGVGKTTLALYWAHRVVGQFPDGQLYVNLRGFDPAAPMTPAEALRGFLDALRGPARPVPPDLDGQGALYRSLMAGRRMLVVLDNARDEEQVRPLLPGAATCLTLITSRGPLAGLVATNGAIPLSLDLLTEADARELLTRRLGPRRVAAEPAAVDQLIAACAGLPLALSIAAARAAVSPDFPLASSAAQLGRPGLDALSGPDPYADLRSVFSWSYRRLSPGAARLFRFLPSFPGPDVSADAAASITPAGLAHELLAELTGAHLLEEYVPGRFRLHDLLARYARECSELQDSEDERREITERVLTWYTAAAATAARVVDPKARTVPDLDKPDPMPAGLTSSAEALGWLETERRNLIAAVDVAARLGVDAIAVTLPLALQAPFQLRGYWHDWLATSLTGIEAVGRTGDLDAEARLHLSIARACVRLGRAHEGIAGLHRALAIWKAQRNLSEQAACHHNLSTAYFEVGRVAEAISESERALELARQNGDQLREGRMLHDLATMHQRTAQPDKALSCYLAAEAIATSLQNVFLAGGVQANVASLYLELGRTGDAITAATAGIELNEQCGAQVEVANSHRVLGDALQRTGRHTEAGSHWRAALAIYAELDDPQAEEVAARLPAG